jgi:hypothetical protein
MGRSGRQVKIVPKQIRERSSHSPMKNAHIDNQSTTSEWRVLLLPAAMRAKRLFSNKKLAFTFNEGPKLPNRNGAVSDFGGGT